MPDSSPLSGAAALWPRLGLLFSVPIGFLFWLAWVCADDWSHNPNYGHGWFILPLFAFFLWRRIEEIPPATKPPGQLPVQVFYFIPLIILILEMVRLTPFYWRPVLWLIYFTGAVITLGVAYNTYGKAGLRVVGFPLLFLALAVPWPTFIELRVIREFSFIIASIVGEFLLLLGVFNEVSGRIIHVEQGAIGVDEACSGLRSLQSSLMIALAVGEWFRMEPGKRILLFVIGIGGAFVLNLLRALTLSLLVTQGGADAMDRWHDTVGLVALALLTVFLLGLGWCLRPRESKEPEMPLRSVLDTGPPPLPRGLLVISALCWTAFLSAHGWYAIGSSIQKPESAFLAESHWPDRIRVESVPEMIADILRQNEGGYLVLDDGNSRQFLGYHFFWKPNRNNGKVLFHRPDTCVPGSGWTQVGAASLFSGSLNGRPTLVHRFLFERGSRRFVLLWSCWADEAPLSFAGNPYSNLQISFIPEFIRLRKRSFSVEILGVMADETIDEADEIQIWLQSRANLVFVPGKTGGGR
jgi:exosortase